MCGALKPRSWPLAVHEAVKAAFSRKRRNFLDEKPKKKPGPFPRGPAWSSQTRRFDASRLVGLGQVAQHVVQHAAVLEVFKLGRGVDAAADREAGDAAVGRAVELDDQLLARRQVLQAADRDD